MNTSEGAYIPKILRVGHAVGDDGSFHGNHRTTQGYGFRHSRMNFHIWNVRNWRIIYYKPIYYHLNGGGAAIITIADLASLPPDSDIASRSSRLSCILL